jgi:hypothetical protein
VDTLSVSDGAVTIGFVIARDGSFFAYDNSGSTGTAARAVRSIPTGRGGRGGQGVNLKLFG